MELQIYDIPGCLCQSSTRGTADKAQTLLLAGEGAMKAAMAMGAGGAEVAAGGERMTPTG